MGTVFTSFRLLPLERRVNKALKRFGLDPVRINERVFKKYSGQYSPARGWKYNGVLQKRACIFLKIGDYESDRYKVLLHEIGHHIQYALGLSGWVESYSKLNHKRNSFWSKHYMWTPSEFTASLFGCMFEYLVRFVRLVERWKILRFGRIIFLHELEALPEFLTEPIQRELATKQHDKQLSHVLEHEQIQPVP